MNKCVLAVRCGGPLALVIALMVLAIPVTSGERLRAAEAPAKGTQLRLDIHPFTEPVSISVKLTKDGDLHMVRFNRNLLVVSEVRQRNLRAADREELLAPVGSREFRQAAQRKNFGGEGLSSGDQFHLFVDSEQDEGLEIFGFVPDAPPVVQGLIEKLLDLGKRAEKASVAAAYIRIERLKQEQAAKLRREGQARFYQVEDFAVEVRPVLSSALAAPGFVGLEASQRELIARRGEQFYLSKDDAVWQATLFSARK